MIHVKKTIGYVSEIDRLLAEFDRTHPPSAAQRAEIKKYNRIYQLRDNADISKQQEPTE